jgi:hypothetical protein
MPVLYTHDAAHTRAYLQYRDYPADHGAPLESVMLPGMEYLVLFEARDDTYAVVAYGIDELLPVVVLEEGIPAHIADYALAFHANLLASPQDPTVFELTRLAERHPNL